MGLIRRTGGNPVAEDAFFLVAERFVGGRRRHHLVGIVREDPSHDFARVGFSGNDRHVARTGLGEDRLAQIEPQLCLPGHVVRSMALETMLAENRADVAGEIGRLRPLGGGNGGRGQSNEKRNRDGLHDRSLFLPEGQHQAAVKCRINFLLFYDILRVWRASALRTRMRSLDSQLISGLADPWGETLGE